MTRLRRVLAITGGLAAFGAVAGALAGAGVAVLAMLITDGPREAFDLGLAYIGASYGAPLGAVLFPLSGWLLMRRVPIGRALVATTVGTIIGGLIGLFTPTSRDILLQTIGGGVAGFTLSVLVLRRRASSREPMVTAATTTERPTA